MRVLIVNNTRSGQGDAGIYGFVKELVDTGVETTVRGLMATNSLEHLLRDATDFDRVVAAGGDGTASAIAYALRGSGIPIVAYPAGTANLLPYSLGMPVDVADIADVTIAGSTLDMDLGEMRWTAPDAEAEQSCGFALSAGAGFDAAIMERAEGLKNVLGAGAYFVSALQELSPTVADLTIEIDGETYHTDGIAVIVMNSSKILLDLAVTPDSDVSDGILEVVVIRTRSVAGLSPALWAAFLDTIGDHPDRSPGLDILRGREIRVQAAPALALQHDGETIAGTTPFSVSVLPRAARFVVPDR